MCSEYMNEEMYLNMTKPTRSHVLPLLYIHFLFFSEFLKLMEIVNLCLEFYLNSCHIFIGEVCLDCHPKHTSTKLLSVEAHSFLLNFKSNMLYVFGFIIVIIFTFS